MVLKSSQERLGFSKERRDPRALKTTCLASNLHQKERDRDKRKEMLHLFEVRTQNSGMWADPTRIHGYLSPGDSDGYLGESGK